LKEPAICGYPEPVETNTYSGRIPSPSTIMLFYNGGPVFSSSRIPLDFLVVNLYFILFHACYTSHSYKPLTETPSVQTTNF
jgi:hypothetical protein